MDSCEWIVSSGFVGEMRSERKLNSLHHQRGAGDATEAVLLVCVHARLCTSVDFIMEWEINYSTRRMENLFTRRVELFEKVLARLDFSAALTPIPPTRPVFHLQRVVLHACPINFNCCASPTSRLSEDVFCTDRELDTRWICARSSREIESDSLSRVDGRAGEKRVTLLSLVSSLCDKRAASGRDLCVRVHRQKIPSYPKTMKIQLERSFLCSTLRVSIEFELITFKCRCLLTLGLLSHFRNESITTLCV